MAQEMSWAFLAAGLGGLAGLGVFGVQMHAMCCFAPLNFAKFLFSEIIDAFKTLPFARTTRLTEKQKIRHLELKNSRCLISPIHIAV